MATITLTRSRLESLYRQLYDLPLPGKFMFGVRGAKPTPQGSLTLTTTDQTFDVYDDAIGFMLESGAGHCYRGSVDPGRYYTKHPLDRNGCAHPIDQHFQCFKGSHKSEPRAWKGKNVKCWRDHDRDNVQDIDERKIYSITWSIDIHYGGRGNTVGEYSAGCQVVHRPGWEEFRDATYHSFGNEATFWLISARTLMQMDRDEVIPSVKINGQLLPRSIPMWMSENDGRMVAMARPFLNHLAFNGQPISFQYAPTQDTPGINIVGGGHVNGVLVHNQLVCRVGDMLRALEPGMTLAADNATKRITGTSTLVSLLAPSTVELAELPMSDVAIPDTVQA